MVRRKQAPRGLVKIRNMRQAMKASLTIECDPIVAISEVHWAIGRFFFNGHHEHVGVFQNDILLLKQSFWRECVGLKSQTVQSNAP
jgi:hypothetical protein